MPIVSLRTGTGNETGIWREGSGNIEGSLATVSAGWGNASVGRTNCYFRFSAVAIPKGAIINAATLTLRASVNRANVTVNTRLSAVAADNPSAPSTYNGAENATRTTAQTNWHSIPAWTSGTTYTSPAITGIIQELVNRPGWQSGNAIIIYWEDDNSSTSSNNTHRAAFGDSATSTDRALLTVDFSPPNSPPEITSPPVGDYGSLTRSGPANSPISVEFEAEDAEDTGTDELTVEIRTAAAGGGTLVATDDYTSGTAGSISIAHDASGLSEGSNTLYIRVGDGTDWSDDESFTLLVDRSAPAAFTPSSNVNPVVGNKQYTVALTANDSHSDGTDELTVEIRTGAGGTGAVLWSGSRTRSASPFNTGTITDSTLVDGSNTRYARVVDGAGNVREATFTVTAAFTVSGTATGSIELTASADGVVTPVWGSATGTIEFTATATGLVVTPFVFGTATGSLEFSATANGVLAFVSGSAAGSVDFSASADGVIAYLSGSAVGSLAFSANAAGVVTPIWGSAHGTISFDSSTAGVIAFVSGSATGSIEFTATATGQVLEPYVYGHAHGLILFSATGDGIVFPVVSSIPVISPRRREPLFYLSLYPPIGSPDHRHRLDMVDINPLLTGLSWQTSWPGGFAQLTAGYDLRESALDRPLANPRLPRDMVTRDYAHVLLTDGRLTIWEGRLGEEDRAPDTRRTLAARGYGYTALSDHPWITTSDTPIGTDSIVRSVLAEAAPAIRPASSRTFQPPLEERVPAAFAWFHPLQVLDQLHIEGDSQGLRMDWGVWEDRRLHMYPRQTPAIADYWIAYDSRYLADWRYIPPEGGVVYVRHTVDGEEVVTGPVTNPRFVRTVGFQRSIVLSAGEISVDGATRIARTWLQEQSQGRYVGQVVIGPDDALMAPGGRPVPSYLVRAGQWLQVGDHLPLLIVTHEHNPNTGRTRLQIGDRVTSYTARINALLRDQERERRGMHPGGGRIR